MYVENGKESHELKQPRLLKQIKINYHKLNCKHICEACGKNYINTIDVLIF